jgi:hypothetical protein
LEGKSAGTATDLLRSAGRASAGTGSGSRRGAREPAPPSSTRPLSTEPLGRLNARTALAVAQPSESRAGQVWILTDQSITYPGWTNPPCGRRALRPRKNCGSSVRTENRLSPAPEGEEGAVSRTHRPCERGIGGDGRTAFRSRCSGRYENGRVEGDGDGCEPEHHREVCPVDLVESPHREALSVTLRCNTPSNEGFDPWPRSGHGR